MLSENSEQQNESNSQDNDSEIIPQLVEVYDDKDDFLQIIVDSINLDENSEVYITLQVSGLLVSGRLISGDRYFDKIADIFFPNINTVDSDKQKILDLGISYRQARIQPQPERGNIAYIHLENCDIVQGNNSRHCNLWRGRVAQVDAFFFDAYPNTEL